jgi:hypothetical protein
MNYKRWFKIMERGTLQYILGFLAKISIFSLTFVIHHS